MNTDLMTQLQAENARLRADNARLEALLTQRTSAEERWRESINQRCFEPCAILDEAVDFISMADLDGRVGYLNHAGRRLVGIDETADIGQFRIADMHPPWATDLIIGEAIPAALRDNVWRGETALVTRAGREIPISQTILVHRTPYGEAQFLFTIARDITEQRRAQEKLAWEARVNAALAEVSRALLGQMTVDDMAYLVLEHAKRLTGSAYGFVGHIDPMTGYLVTSTFSRDIWDVRQVQGRAVIFKEFKGLWGWVLNHRQSLLTNAPAADPRSSGTLLGHIPIQRFISAPAVAEGTLVGQLALANADRDYTESDLALIERLADLYAIAVQRRRMEESLRESEGRFAAFMDHLPAAAFIKDDQSRHVYVNKYLEDYFNARDWLNRNAAEVFPVELVQTLSINDRKVLSEGVSEFEEAVARADGEIRYFRTIKFPMRTSAAPSLIGGIAIDITDHQRARDALQQSETKYRRLHETMRDAFVSVDMTGRIRECNMVYRTLLGYSEDELYRLTYQDLTPKEWHAFEADIIERQVLPKGYSDIYQKEYRRKDGSIFPVEMRIVLIQDAADRPTGMWAIVRDITERKRVEETLRASEAKFRRLIEALPVAMCVSNGQGNIEYLNARFTEQFGYRREDVPCVEEWFLRAYPDPIYRQGILESWIAGMENARRNSTDIALADIEITHRDGSLRVVNLVGTLMEDKVLAIFNNITDRKRTETALRASEEKYRLLVENQTDLVVKIDTENRFLFISPSYCEMFGKTEEELLNRTFMPLVHEEDRELTAKSMTRLLQPPYTTYHEQRALTKTGWRWLAWSAKSILGEDNQVVAVVGIGRDITERKQAESALRESEDRFAAFMDNLPAITFIKGHDSRTLFVNRYFRQLFGEGWLNKTVSDLFPAELAAAMIADDRQALAEGFQRREELLPLANGETRLFETIKFPLHRVGKPTLLGGFAIDITERKQAEAELRHYREHLEEMVADRTRELALANQQLRLEMIERQRVEGALRDSEGRLRMALESAQAGVWEWNVKANTHIWSDENYRVLGLQPHSCEPTYENWLRVVHPDDHEIAEANVAKAMEQRGNLDFEIRILAPDGAIRWVQEIGKTLHDDRGQPERIIGLSIDATERKRTEEALRDSETRLRLALQAADTGVWDWDLQKDANAVSERFFEILGMDGKALPVSLATLLQSIHPDDRAWAEFRARELVERGKDMDLQFRIVRPDGEIRWVQDFGTLIRDAAGRPLRMIGTMTDITERKRIEIELQNYRDHLEILVDERTAALEATNRHLQQEIAERRRAEEKIKASLREKEVLLKEIHHRVKNNLQVITSLLDLQAGVVGDPATREKFRESRDRVRSMALIHERLYRAADLASINFAEYVKNLIDSLLSSYAGVNRAIALRVDIEPLAISVEHAVPCGLIINELITNALKYAFPQGGGGIIGVELRKSEGERVLLRVWDNGVGLPSSIDPRQSETLGLTIVATLVKQLRGDLTLQRVGGAGFTITFVAPPVKTAQSILERK